MYMFNHLLLVAMFKIENSADPQTTNRNNPSRTGFNFKESSFFTIDLGTFPDLLMWEL